MSCQEVASLGALGVRQGSDDTGHLALPAIEAGLLVLGIADQPSLAGKKEGGQNQGSEGATEDDHRKLQTPAHYAAFCRTYSLDHPSNLAPKSKGVSSR